MCIAYIDPGNLEADLQTGAQTGYSLLWVLLWSTLLGFLLQSLAAKLGCVTGRHLAQHCRDQYSRPVRIVLWLMAEFAIIGSDIQEVIGTAIALLLLSQGAIPLWAGVIVAAVAAYVLLFLEKLGIRWLEVFFQLLIAVMAVSMGALAFYAGVPSAEVIRGLVVPTLPASAMPTAAGLIGAIIMPHNLYLHGALVHNRALPPSMRSCGQRESLYYYNMEAAFALGITLCINTAVISVFSKGFYGRKHGAEIGLENAGQFLGRRFGAHMQWIWAVGLLAAGQSSTMTGTYAGQFVMDGFLNLKIPALQRALITRAVALAPTLLVAIKANGQSFQLDWLNQALNILQAVQLPFAVVPLLALTSSKHIVGIGFANSWSTAAACWTVAVAIVAVNGGTAYHTAVNYLPDDPAVHLLFWAFVACYLLFVAYLVFISLKVAYSLPAASGGHDRDGGLEDPLLGGGEEVVTPRVPPLNVRPLSPPLGVRPTSPPLKMPRPDSARSDISSHALAHITPS